MVEDLEYLGDQKADSDHDSEENDPDSEEEHDIKSEREDSEKSDDETKGIKKVQRTSWEIKSHNDGTIICHQKNEHWNEVQNEEGYQDENQEEIQRRTL